MMMMRYGLGALAMALALGAAPVRADVIRVFEANGVFDDGVKLGGTVTIDVTTGDVTSANLLLSEPVSAEVTGLGNSGESGGGFAKQFTSVGSGGPFPLIVLLFTTPSLVGYGGGPLASSAMPQGGFSSEYGLSPDEPVGLASGTLTVPEPSTWAMMLMGFAGLGFAGYRASRRTAAAAT
jgi:PEP-CTERM motif